MAKNRLWMIEGEWSGYENPASANQKRVVHRHYVVDGAFAEKCRGQSVYYTDGTALRIIVTEVTHSGVELPHKESYTKLINQCVRENCWKVAELKNQCPAKNT